ncbi:MAG: hypothetical protein QNK40_10845 [Desulfobacterales bacterium]|nr:hypothetical protein [Desulfobacterales bacterium]
MGLLNLLFKDPLGFILIAIPLLYAIIFHELAHGWVSTSLSKLFVLFGQSNELKIRIKVFKKLDEALVWIKTD